MTSSTMFVFILFSQERTIITIQSFFRYMIIIYSVQIIVMLEECLEEAEISMKVATPEKRKYLVNFVCKISYGSPNIRSLSKTQRVKGEKKQGFKLN